MTREPLTEEAVFKVARKIGAIDARADYLRQVCADNGDLQARVEELLRAHDEEQSFLESPAAAPFVPTINELPVSEGPGTQIGPYKLLQPIGEGGMGTVYMAEQTAPVQRKVALKLIKPGMDSRQVISRFEAERQALALMDHPNIARILDAGTTSITSPPLSKGGPGGVAWSGEPAVEPDAGVDWQTSQAGKPDLPGGQPYFVMELVKGVPITKYCDEHRLNPRERLELFIPVCQAVQHAHQKGIIHRDLKPSNVLVALYDGRPVPKVIDFGVAKATGQKLTERTMYTEFGAIVGTLEYMSPEQAESNQLDIDTRSDIYSLGVLLYELLTGTTPFEKKRLKDAALVEILRIIREDEPQKPSTRLSTTDELPSISANRGLEPNKLSALVRGELDWIVMKALEKDRNRRYETANGFAMDIQRYLADEPVQACPPSAGYRLRKFARRNKAAFAIGATVAAALVVAIVALVVSNVLVRSESHQKELALEEKDRALIEKGEALKAAEKANDLLGSIFENLNPSEIARADRPLQAILVEKLDRAVAELGGESIGDPLVVAAVQHKFGRSLLGLGEPAKAIVLLEKARSTRQARLGRGNPDTLSSMNYLAWAYRDAGMPDLAQALYLETVQLCKAKLAPDHEQTLAAINGLALAYNDAGKLDLALPLYKEALRLSKATLGPKHPSTLTIMNNLASTYKDARMLNLALALFEETLQLRKATLGPEDPETFISMGNLALAYQNAGKLDLALPLHEETVQLEKARLGRDHPSTLISMENLAHAYLDTGKPDLGVRLMEETVQLSKAKLGPDHPQTLKRTNNLAVMYQVAGKLDLALPLYEETFQRWKARLGPERRETQWSMDSLARAYQAAEKLDLALPLFEERLHLYRAQRGPDDPVTLVSMDDLARAYLAAGKLDLALPLFEVALQLSIPKLGPEHPNTLRRMTNLADMYERLGRLEEAVETLSGLLKVQPDNLDVRYRRGVLQLYALDDWYRHGLLQLKAGKWDEAVAVFAKLLNMQPETAAEWQNRAEHFIRLGLWNEAAADYGKDYELREPEDAMGFYLHALTRLYAGDADGYRKISRRLAERFAESADTENAHLTAVTGAIDTPPVVAPAQLVALAERGVANRKVAWQVACLGLAYYRAGEYQRAVASLRESLAINANWDRTWVESCLAMAQHRLGNVDFARAALDEARRATDERVEAMLAGEISFVPANWWDLLHAELLYREARTVIDGSPPPEDPRWLVLRARGLETIGRTDEAQALFARAFALQPDDLRIRVLALPHVSRTEACAQGLADLRTFFKEHPNQPDESRLALARAHLQLGTRQWRARRRPEAEAALDQAIEVAPQNAQLWLERGNLWLSVNEAARAIGDFSKALEQTEDAGSKSAAYQQRGLAHSRLGRYAEARDDWQQAVDLAPKGAEAHNSLAWLLATSPDAALRDPQRAVALAVKAVEMQPTVGTYWNTLGVAHYRVGDWKGAVEALTKSRELKNSAPAVDWFFLAMTEWRQENRDEARRWYDQAAAWREQNATNDEELQRFEAEAKEVLEVK